MKSGDEGGSVTVTEGGEERKCYDVVAYHMETCMGASCYIGGDGDGMGVIGMAEHDE